MSETMTEQKEPFSVWAAELELLANGAYGPNYDFTQECWRESYDSGMSPQEALASDMVYWEAE